MHIPHMPRSLENQDNDLRKSFQELIANIFECKS